MPFLLAILSHWTLRPPNFSKQSILIHYVLLAMGHRDNKELEQQQQQKQQHALSICESLAHISMQNSNELL